MIFVNQKIQKNLNTTPGHLMMNAAAPATSSTNPQQPQTNLNNNTVTNNTNNPLPPGNGPTSSTHSSPHQAFPTQNNQQTAQNQNQNNVPPASQVNQLPNGNQSKSGVSGRISASSNNLQSANNSASRNQQINSQLQNLTELYSENQCGCTSDECKKPLNEKMREMMKVDLSEESLRNFISYLKGSQKNQKTSKFLPFFLRYIEYKNLDCDTFEQCLDLFTVIYLKSDSIVQCVLLKDIFLVLKSIKDSECTVFADKEKKFKLKIIIYRIHQFLNCFRQASPCQLKNQPSSLEDESIYQCEVHGQIEHKDATVDLTEDPSKFHQYTCFLAALQFRIFNIMTGTPITQKLKQSKQALTCNLLSNYLMHCEEKHIYYPLRALSECFNIDSTWLAQSKCLNAESFLLYKLNKEGLEQQLNRYQTSTIMKKNTGPLTGQLEKDQSLKLDVLEILKSTLDKISGNQQFAMESMVLCLKMLGKVVEVDMEDRKTNAIQLFENCLARVATYLPTLSDVNKEVFYTEIKRLICLIKAPLSGQAHQNSQTNPKLHELKQILSLKVVGFYPKLSLLLYDLLIQYMPIFDNELVSIYQQCKQACFIDEMVNIDKSNGSCSKTTLNYQRRVQVNDLASQSRKDLLSFYTTHYKRKLQELALERLKGANQHESEGGVISEQQYKRVEQEINEYDSLRLRLNSQEITYIVDFLIDVCKHAQIGNIQALVLGSNLIPALKIQQSESLNSVIKEASQDDKANSELLFCIYAMRVRYYLRFGIEDELFEQLYRRVSKEIFATAQQQFFDPQGGRMYLQRGTRGDMGIYTSQYLQTIFEILQHRFETLNIPEIQRQLDEMVQSKKIILFANTLPLYFQMQMYLVENTGNSNNLAINFCQIVKNIFANLEKQIKDSRSRVGAMKQRMLWYYQMRNLIWTYTSILKYLVCFQTPPEEKTSSAELYTQQKSQLACEDHPMNGQQDRPPIQLQGMLQSEQQHAQQQTFLVRRQKLCNFCGTILPKPNRFTYSRKCPHCNLKSSTLVLPARFMCNHCVDTSKQYLFETAFSNDKSQKHQMIAKGLIPEQNLKNFGVLMLTQQDQSHSCSTFVQDAILSSLNNCMNGPEVGTDGFGWSAEFKSTKVGCLTKTQDQQMLGMHIQKYLCQRMLKLILVLQQHSIAIKTELRQSFDRFAESMNEFDQNGQFAVIQAQIGEIKKGFEISDIVDQMQSI